MPTTDFTSNSRQQAVARAHLTRLLMTGLAETGTERDAKALYSQALKAGYNTKIVDDTAVKTLSEKKGVGRRFLVAGRIFSMADLAEYLPEKRAKKVSSLDLFEFVDCWNYAREDDALRVRRLA